MNYRKDNNMDKRFIIWYSFDGEEDYMIITAPTEDEALRRFRGWHSETVIDIHEVADDERYLAFI